MSFWRGQITQIATAPLVAVCFDLVLAVLPLGDKLAPWSIVVFGAAILFRSLANRQRWRLPSGPLRIAVLAAGVGGVALFSGGMAGFESWLGVLLVLLSMKLIETNSVRDFQVLVLLGWFFCLCGLCFSQDLTTWLYLSGVTLLLAGSLLRFHRATARGGLGSAILPVLKMLGQAMPVIVLLFLFFPRIRGDFRIQFGRPNSALTGMGDQLSPGSIARLTRNESLAFRAEFPDGNIPPVSQLYWRGAVLWRGEGLTWTRGFPDMRVEKRAGQLEGTAIRQQIFLKPHGGRWLVALDRPASDVRDATLEAGGFLQSNRPVVSPVVYTVISRPENRETALIPIQRLEALRKPELISPRVQALVDSWRGAGEREIVEAALRYFRQEKFVYSLEPNTYGGDAFSEFLFERRIGFCEHYAAAFATLVRLAGIPSRIVVGYHGGELGLGNYVIVRQLDAHAWAEVWLKGEGWHRIDPTNLIAPGRLVSGSESLLDQARGQNAAVDGSGSTTGLPGFMREARLFWDRISYQWDLRIVSYSDSSQRSMLTLVGLEKLSPPMIVFWLVVGIVFVLSLLGWWLARPRDRRRRDPLVGEYQRFCRRLAAAGLARQPDEGPLRFSERAAIAFPRHADAIRDVAAFYIAARYAGDVAAAGHFKRAARALPRLDRTRARAGSPA